MITNLYQKRFRSSSLMMSCEFGWFYAGTPPPPPTHPVSLIISDAALQHRADQCCHSREHRERSGKVTEEKRAVWVPGRRNVSGRGAAEPPGARRATFSGPVWANMSPQLRLDHSRSWMGLKRFGKTSSWTVTAGKTRKPESAALKIRAHKMFWCSFPNVHLLYYILKPKSNKQ